MVLSKQALGPFVRPGDEWMYGLPPRSYNTNANYQGSYKSRKLVKAKRKVPYVLQDIFEKRGIENDADGMYIGSSTDFQRLTNGVFAMVIHLLLKKAGVTINDWNDLITRSVHWSIQWGIYGNMTSTSPTLTTLDFIADLSPITMRDNLVQNIIDTIGENRFHKFSNFILLDDDEAVCATVNPDKLWIKSFVSNNLLIQNRSVAAGVDDDINTTTNVSANPVYGRVYSRTGNTLMSHMRSGPACLFTWNSPYIFQSLSTFDLADRNIDNTKFIKTKTSGRIHLKPGGIKNFKNSYSHYKNFQGYSRLLAEFLKTAAGGTEYQIKNFGKIQVVGFEKMLDAGSEPDLVLGYELNSKYCFGYKYSSKVVAPSIYGQDAT